MKCPHCGHDFPPPGSAKGGSVKGPTKARDPEKMRAGANKRWAAYRAAKAAKHAE